MAVSRFEVFKDVTGKFKFRLKAPNGEIIATYEGYTTKALCLMGIKSVMKNAPIAEIMENIYGSEGARRAFEVFKDVTGKFKFRLKAPNGETIAISEGYTTKASCLNGIKMVRKNAPIAKIEEIL